MNLPYAKVFVLKPAIDLLKVACQPLANAGWFVHPDW
jgi:hypothetical protein